MPCDSGATSRIPFRAASLGECVASRPPRNKGAGAALPRPPACGDGERSQGPGREGLAHTSGLITSHSCRGNGARAQPWARHHGSSCPLAGWEQWWDELASSCVQSLGNLLGWIPAASGSRAGCPSQGPCQQESFCDVQQGKRVARNVSAAMITTPKQAAKHSPRASPRSPGVAVVISFWEDC